MEPCSNRPSRTSTTCCAKRPAAPPSSTTPSRPRGCCSSNTSTVSNRTERWRPSAAKAGNTPSSSIKPYRWESWAAPKGKDGRLDHNNAMTGDDLRDFVNQKLFPYLHGFTQKASGPNTIEYKIGADLRRDQKQDLQRLQPSRDHRPHRRVALPLADRKTRAVGALRRKDQAHGQCRAQRRRVLHPAPADPRHRPGHAAQDRRAHL